VRDKLGRGGVQLRSGWRGCRRRVREKSLRGTIKKIATVRPGPMPATIEGLQVLDEIGARLKGRVFVVIFLTFLNRP